MKGLVPYRIETIPLASTFISYIIKKFSLSRIRLSTYSLREGVISELDTD
jgi:exopolyphosphatase/pppGpp-phosphohydrolase